MGREHYTFEHEAIWLRLVVILLLLVGLGSSLYLEYLYFKVHTSGNVESFCAISRSFNCVTVTSRYASFLGVPVALYGLEFFAAVLCAVLWLHHWESMVFDATALSLPVCAALAWISFSQIDSICVMCCLVYGVNLLVFLLVGLVNRRRIRALVVEGPQELLQGLAARKGSFALCLLLFLSQFFWVPRLIPVEAQAAAAQPDRHPSVQAWHGLPTAGLSIGRTDAPIVIEEFTDFECGCCGKAHRIMMQVLQQFPDKIRLVHRDYPQDKSCHPTLRRRFHRNACQAAYYARCAAGQEKYWAYEERLFTNRRRLAVRDLLAYAGEVGLDIKELQRCVASPRTHEAVAEDLKEGIRRNVSGTPTFFIGGKFGEMIAGRRSHEYWEAKIRSLLRE